MHRGRVVQVGVRVSLEGVGVCVGDIKGVGGGAGRTTSLEVMRTVLEEHSQEAPPFVVLQIRPSPASMCTSVQRPRARGRGVGGREGGSTPRLYRTLLLLSFPSPTSENLE